MLLCTTPSDATVHNPQSIPDLKTEITATVKAILRKEYEKVIENFVRRI